MDGEKNGKPYEQMDDLGGFPTHIFGSTPIFLQVGPTHNSRKKQSHGSIGPRKDSSMKVVKFQLGQSQNDWQLVAENFVIGFGSFLIC